MPLPAPDDRTHSEGPGTFPGAFRKCRDRRMNIMMNRAGEGLEVSVENPFSELLLAGELAAFYQAAEGCEPDFQISTVEEAILNFRIKPK